jgi:hypothetical protein
MRPEELAQARRYERKYLTIGLLLKLFSAGQGFVAARWICQGDGEVAKAKELLGHKLEG